MLSVFLLRWQWMVYHISNTIDINYFHGRTIVLHFQTIFSENASAKALIYSFIKSFSVSHHFVLLVAQNIRLFSSTNVEQLLLWLIASIDAKWWELTKSQFFNMKNDFRESTSLHERWERQNLLDVTVSTSLYILREYTISVTWFRRWYQIIWNKRATENDESKNLSIDFGMQCQSKNRFKNHRIEIYQQRPKQGSLFLIITELFK